jgi:hypothetical protein
VETITVARVGQTMQVMAQQIGTDNQRWFQVILKVGAGSVSGWVRADLVQEVGDYVCPPLQ